MQKDICYNVEKMHEPFPFTQDNQWNDSYFCKGENALPGSLIKSKPNWNLPTGTEDQEPTDETNLEPIQ